MKVRMKIAWGQYTKGHIVPEMGGGMARGLIARGIAEEVTDEPPALEAPVNRMLKSKNMARKTAA